MTTTAARIGGRGPVATAIRPEAYFLASAVFHYLGPSLAVLLFSYVGVLGVAWLRVVSAALVFAAWRRPWRVWAHIDPSARTTVLAWGAVLALMNCAFYLAVARLPLATVAGIEFLPVIALAASGTRTLSNVAALVLAVGGVSLLTNVVLTAEPLGVMFAFANAGLFAGYIALGHGVARAGVVSGIDSLALAMLVAAVVVTPIGVLDVLPALAEPVVLLAGLGVGVTSSVIPYVLDQLAMARIKRSTFAMLLSLLPATAALVGIVVLGQMPTTREWIGVTLVGAAVALHRDAEAV